ncbi:MBOAT family protein [Candidatus Woesearchaeota archaeon]|nr:MBOAT family protein [Candidatus Woesearchaeota archaeon]
MLFNSVHFLIFFPIVTALYFTIKHKYRWILLLLASYYFYMSWKPEYALLLLFSTIITFYTAIGISNTQNQKLKQFYLWMSIIINLSMLFFFKYFNFANDSVKEFLALFSIHFEPFVLNVLLPVGISFYTFQAISYSVDVYNNKVNPERNFGMYALYHSFFPQLVAGPIERAGNLLHQFYEEHRFEYKRVADGLKLMLWGFFKKVVVADRLAIIVNTVYNNVGDYTGLYLLVGTIFFAFQIYCDFSGYSDIAIGSAQIMGFRLMDNFKRPYFSKSIPEFWRRWHISLSSWFRDYLYIPLGGSRISVPRGYFNLFIIFLVSGLWHGAKWTFVIWGILHGTYMIFSLATKNGREYIVNKAGLGKFPRIHHLFKIAFVFSLVCFSWIFFRANNAHDALNIISKIFTNFSFDFSAHLLNIGWPTLIIALSSIALLEFVHLIQSHISIREFLDSKALYMRWWILIIIIISILLFGVFEQTEFIYFQF